MFKPYFHLIELYTFLIIISSTLSFLVLKLIEKSNKNFLPILFLKASKSSSNANLLGGLSFSVSAFVASLSALFFFRTLFTRSEFHIFKYCLLPFLLVTAYGYIDDRMEIRARHKLVLQFVTVLGVLLPVTMRFYPGHPLFFGVGMFFGLAYMNGCNLIDGADTLFAKVGMSSSVGFFIMGYFSHSIPVMSLSLIAISSLSIFYFFNKEPAKIYTGEIGVGLMGLFFLAQGIFLFQKLNPFSIESLHVLSKILIVSFLPVAELAISFLRRVWAGKSPFRGDQLHLHHILKNKFKLSPTQISNFMALFNISLVSFGLVLSTVTNPIIALALTTVVFCSVQYIVCGKNWKTAKGKMEFNSLFMSLREKPIHVINGKIIENAFHQYEAHQLPAEQKRAA